MGRSFGVALFIGGDRMDPDEIERLLVRVEANAVQFENQMKRVNRALYGSAAEVRKTQAQIKRDMDRAWKDVGSSVVVPVQAASALALAALTGFSINAAKRAEAVDGAFEQTFRNMPDRARAAVSDIAADFERLETDIKDRATQMQGVITALGVDAETALSIVDSLTRRSLDMAAFKDVSDAEAFRAVISGLTGETEPLKKFGVVLNETAVKAELMRLGFKGNAQQASEAAKVIARTNIILQRTRELEGQVAREAENLTEKEKRAQATFQQSAENFGKQFLPVAKEVLIWATDALEAFNNLPTGVQNAGLALLALTAASGPIGAAIKGLKALIAAATAARVAVAAIGGGSAAKAAAGGAAAGAGAGALARFAPVAALGAGLSVSLGSGTQAPERTPELVEGIIAQLRAAPQNDRTRAGIARHEAELRVLKRQAEMRRFAAGDHSPDLDAAAKAQLDALGDFGLSEAQRRPTGAPGGNGGSGDAAARQAAERREALALERAIDLARASGDDRAIAAAEERQTLARLTADYQAAGYADANAQAMEHLSLLNQAKVLAEGRAEADKAAAAFVEDLRRVREEEADAARAQNDLLLDQIQMRAQLADLRGDDGALRSAERELWIEQRINELLNLRKGLTRTDARGIATGEADEIEEASAKGRFRDLVVQAGTDFRSLAEDAGDRFKRRALEGLADMLWNLVQGAFSGAQGGGSGFLSRLVNAIPGFSSGTNSAPGGLAYVHGGEVLTNLKPGTKVIPAHAVKAMGAMVGGLAANPVREIGGHLSVSVDLTGANGDAAIASAAEAAAMKGAMAAIAASRLDAVRAQRASRQRFV